MLPHFWSFLSFIPKWGEKEEVNLTEKLGNCSFISLMETKLSLLPRERFGLIYRLPCPRSPSTLLPKSTEKDEQHHSIWRLGGPESSPDTRDLRELWAPWAPAPVKEGAFVNSAGRLDTCAGAGEPWEGISCNPSIYRQQQGETQVPSPFQSPFCSGT